MDPNETLRLIGAAETRQEILEHSRNLHTWLTNGGFEPNWQEYPVSTSRYLKWRGK